VIHNQDIDRKPVGRKVRFDLKVPQTLPETEVRLKARSFIKKQGDEAIEVNIVGKKIGLDHTGDRPKKVVTYYIHGRVQ
jgi:hypothetical protein